MRTFITIISTEPITTLIATTELTNIKTTIPTTINKEIISTEISTLPISTAFPSKTGPIFIPTTEPIIEEEEIKELILPEEYNTDPDNCRVIYNNK